MDEDIKRIEEGLKIAKEEEHTPLIDGLEKAISAKKIIQQGYSKHFTKLRQVLKATCAMTSPCGVSLVRALEPKTSDRTSFERPQAKGRPTEQT